LAHPLEYLIAKNRLDATGIKVVESPISAEY
jgi:hypothetical protein